MIRTAFGAALVGLILAALVGCETAPATGEASGTVTVDGQPPPAGSSITFIPAGTSGQTAGGEIKEGRYTVLVPVGQYNVQIRAPRPGAPSGNTDGPGAGDTGGVVESLPAKYNDQTELTIDVKPGKNEKNWDLSTK